MIGTDLEYGDKVRIASGVDEGKRGMIIGIALNRIPTLATIICENGEVIVVRCDSIQVIEHNEIDG